MLQWGWDYSDFNNCDSSFILYIDAKEPDFLWNELFLTKQYLYISTLIWRTDASKKHIFSNMPNMISEKIENSNDYVHYIWGDI